MKVHDLKRVNQGAVLVILIALTCLALRESTLTAGASQTGGKQGRGRMIQVPRSTEGHPADAQLVVSDQEAQAALAEIQGEEQQQLGFSDSRTISVEIAENGTKFTPDESPVFSDGLPAYGNEFITEGYIYPAGTLNGGNGVKSDGSPEFPNRVIGRWYCRGWHVGDAAHATTGAWVITHQLFDFGAQPGRVTIATDGIELVDQHAPFQRAITGGTGQFAQARGEATQTLLIFPNQANGVNLRIDLKVTTR